MMLILNRMVVMEISGLYALTAEEAHVCLPLFLSRKGETTYGSQILTSKNEK